VRVVDVVEHEAEVPRLADGGRRRLVRLDQAKPRRELARPKAGLMKTLALAGAAVERIEMLPLVVVRPGLGGELEMRPDD
jgi:hypothetical protein